MRIAIFSLTMMAAAGVAAQDGSPRVSEAETNAFYALYRKLHPEAHLPNPAFSTRGKGGKRELSATIDGAGQRAVLPLCRAPREIFDYVPRGRPDQRWRARGEPAQVVWIHHTAQCGAAPSNAVQLLAAVPDMDVLRLLQQWPELLGNARLLMAGNTQCSPLRNHPFRLTGLDRGKDGQNVLVFDSSQGGTARITVRLSRNEFQAWGASCSAPKR